RNGRRDRHRAPRSASDCHPVPRRAGALGTSPETIGRLIWAAGPVTDLAAAAPGASSTDAFNYLSVLLSIILGLAITQILKGFRGLTLSRSRVVAYWPSL